MCANVIFPTDTTLKANPVDADLLLIADSAAGNAMKKATIGSITSSIADGVINDSASASTTTYSSTKILALDAVQDASIAAKLPLAGGTMTGLHIQAKGADIASATALPLGTATGNYVDVTGTTTVTSITTSTAGAQIKVRFTGILTLTHNATTLILPTGANIVTAAGDVAEFVSLGSGNWRCVMYTRATGYAIAGGTLGQNMAEVYGSSATGNDTYVVTLSPVPSAYSTGMVINFKPDTANTGAATINVNSLGAKTIKKYASGGKVDLLTGDIQASQMVSVMYDGTDMLMVSAQQPRPLYNFGQGLRLAATGTGTQTVAHGLGVVPRLFKVWYSSNGGNNGAFCTGSGACDSTPTYSCTVNCASNDTNTTDSNTRQVTNAIIKTIADDGTTATTIATVSAIDATNVTLNFTTHSLSVYFQWEAYA